MKDFYARCLKNTKGLTLKVLKSLDFDELKGMWEREQRSSSEGKIHVNPTQEDVARAEAEIKGMHDKPAQSEQARQYGRRCATKKKRSESPKGDAFFDKIKRKRIDEKEAEKDESVHTEMPSNTDEGADLIDPKAMVIKDTSFYEPLKVEYPIINWYQDLDSDRKRCYRVERAGGSKETYRNFSAMLRVFSRIDVDQMFEVGQRLYGGERGYDDNHQLFDFLRQMYMPEPEMRIFMKPYSPITFWYCFESSGVHVYHQLDGSMGYFLVGRIYPWSMQVMFDMMGSKVKCHSLELGSQLVQDIKNWVAAFKAASEKKR